MKKFLSLLLASLMVLSLAACSKDTGGRKVGRPDSSSTQTDDVDKSKGDSSGSGSGSDGFIGPVQPDKSTQETDKTEVTVEELIFNGYGVDIGVPKSATLGFQFMVKEGSRSRTIVCLHEYDGSYDHMVVMGQFNEDGSQVPLDYEFYYSYADDAVWQSSDGEVSAGNANGFKCGLTSVITTPVKSLISNPVLEDEDDSWVVSGKFSASTFNSMLSFVYTDAYQFTEPVDFALVYDKDTKALEGMLWQAKGGATEYVVVMTPEKINSTTVSFEDSQSGSNEGSIGASSDLLSVILYGEEFLFSEDVYADIGAKYPWADEDTLFECTYYCNYFTKDKFLESIANDSYVTESKQKAAVILCKMLGIPKETLYANEFSTKEFVDTYWNK